MEPTLTTVIGSTSRTAWFALGVLFAPIASACDTKPCWDLFDKRDFKALAQCIQTVERTCQTTDPGAAADLLALEGSYAYATGNMALAEEHMLKSQALYLTAGSPWQTGARILRVLGNIAYEQGDYHKGLLHQRELLRILLREDPNAKGALGGAHYNIGSNYWGLDQRDSCTTHYNEALRIWGSMDGGGPPLIAYMHEVLGTYAWERGDETAALDHFNKAAQRQLKDAPASDAADALIDQAWRSAEGDRDQEALRLYEQALEFRERTFGADHPNTACMHSGLAQLLLSMHRPEEALGRAQEAIVRLVPGFRPTNRFTNPNDIGAATSLRHLHDALVLKFRLLERMPGESAAASADELIDLVVQCTGRLRAAALTEDSKLFWTVHVRGFVETALGHCVRQWERDKGKDRVRCALVLLELGRNALLSEALASLEALGTGGLPPGIAAEERMLRSRIAEMGRYVLLEEKKCDRMDVDKLSLWRRALDAATVQLDSLVRRMAEEYPAYHELKYGSAQVDMEALQRRLGDRALLALFDGTQDDFAVLVHSGAMRLVRLAPGTDSLALRVQAAIIDPQAHQRHPQSAYDDYASAAWAVHRSLFGDHVSALPEELTIVPDGAFHHLPFEALLTSAPPAEGRNYATLPYMLRTHVIGYAPGIRAWMMERGTRERKSAYLGMSVSRSGTAQLRSAAQEIDAAHALLGGTALHGGQATEAAFKRAVNDAGVLHLAMHTVVDDLDPMSSSLAFAPGDSAEDGTLHAHELFGLLLPTQLAVLSACRTGEGRMLNGEGILSLARGFAHAGCPALVMSLWNCDDDATRGIVTGFLGAAQDGTPLDRALRDSKLQHLAQADPLRAHPYYWSALVLVGDERELDLAGPWYSSPWLLLLLVVPTLWWLRSRNRAQ
ncbi:MAG: CHAT domain-containing protein [Flavobacteriales bacterium]|nr:CHAT domain-containing protein [Flavobacteriales bacterium]